MAILDTDWVMRPVRALARRGAPADVWEALVERHARCVRYFAGLSDVPAVEEMTLILLLREREELLDWEDRRPSYLRRTTSMETIRLHNEGAPSELEDTSSERTSPASRNGASTVYR